MRMPTGPMWLVISLIAQLAQAQHIRTAPPENQDLGAFRVSTICAWFHPATCPSHLGQTLVKPRSNLVKRPPPRRRWRARSGCTRSCATPRSSRCTRRGRTAPTSTSCWSGRTRATCGASWRAAAGCWMSARRWVCSVNRFHVNHTCAEPVLTLRKGRRSWASSACGWAKCTVERLLRKERRSCGWVCVREGPPQIWHSTSPHHLL